MKTAPDFEYPPVQVYTLRRLEKLLEQRLEMLRAAGIPYVVIHLDEGQPSGEAGGGG